jgi:predicted nucleic acid-binding Zn ribbon protein
VFSGPGFYTTDKREPPHEINLPPIPADEME